MSHAAPWGRGTPRWSMLKQFAPASIAGLPLSSARVSVGPPLFPVRPSFGSVLVLSPALRRPQLSPVSRLCPWDLIGPEQFGPWPPEVTVLRATLASPRETVL